MTGLVPEKTLRAFLSNEAVNAQFSFTSTEIDVMALIILKTQPNKPWTDTVVFHTHELISLKHSVSNGIYQSVKDALTGLASKPYKIFDREKRKFFVSAFISSGEYEENTGKITITMSKQMHEMVINIKREFTAFNIKSLLMLKKMYSKRLYLLCCQFQNTGFRNVTMEEIRTNFGLQNKYPLFADFDRYVLQPAIKEINELTEFKINIEPMRSGRAVHSLDISIESSTIIYSKSSTSESPEITAIKAKLATYGIAEWLIYNVVNQLTIQQINKAIYLMQTATKPVHNPGKYLFTTFQNLGVNTSGKISNQTRLDEQAEIAAALEELRNKPLPSTLPRTA